LTRLFSFKAVFGLADSSPRLKMEALLHQKHLSGSFDSPVEPALIMSRQTGVFSRENASLVGHKLLEQIGVLEIKSVHGEIDFWFRPGSADFHEGTAASSAAFIGFFRASLAWHRRWLFNFPMQRVAPQRGIVLPEFQFFGLQFLVPSGGIAGR
jgi:hypothetical protein